MRLIGMLDSPYVRRVAISFDFLAVPFESCEVDLEAAASLGLEHGLTVYDASYVWLAINRNAGLVTLDRQMARVASVVLAK